MQRRGCISGLGLTFTFIFLIAIGVTIVLQGGPLLASPGPLSAASPKATPLGGYDNHAQFEHECSLCHAPFWGEDRMADRCMACHTQLQEELANQSGLHGRLVNARQCKLCHTEHQGRAASLTKLNIKDFPHDVDVVGFTLKEHRNNFNNTPLECNHCHPISFAEFDQQTCIDCHREGQPEFTDTHLEDVGKDCLACHDGNGDAEKFDHAVMTNFPLEGKHQKTACEACHPEERYAGQDSACTSCHGDDDVHQGNYGTSCESCHTAESWEEVTFRHDRAPFLFDGQILDIQTQCITCHRQDDKHQGDLGIQCEQCHTTERWQEITFNHDQTNFPLDGKHRPLACEACHTQGRLQIDAACVSCHQQDDEHDGQLGNQCNLCHTTNDWEEVTFDHNDTAFPLTGKHNEITCEACHTDENDGQLDSSCISCHRKDDIHEGAYGDQCATCHATDNWERISFNHSTQTQFPLTGKHTTLTCDQCHVSADFTDLDPACVSCHLKDDKHQGAFGPRCEDCHGTSRWDDVIFEHTLTNFPLLGAHLSVSCDQCHVSGQYAGTPTECVACHPEPESHAGLFGTDCIQCHTSTSWTPALLPDHTFPLNHGSPTILACNVCHDQNNYTAYTCYNCHEHTPANIRNEHLEEGITNYEDCVRCHPTGREEEGEFGEEDDD